MTHELVRITRTDDGEEKDDPKWCLVDVSNPCGSASLCGGEFFGGGESACEYETKVVKRGGITCGTCLERLKAYKAIKL